MTAALAIRRLLRAAGMNPTDVYHRLSAWSLRAALKEQGLVELVDTLRGIEPNLREQYSRPVEEGEYQALRELKTRGMHAFQVQMLLKAIERVGGDGITVADIGDSSGTHSLYMRQLAPRGKVARVFSVNLDPVAVQKVRDRGLEAILSPAESLDPSADAVDLYASFETLEHFSDPLRFLHRLAAAGLAETMVFTVPYRRVSRFGGWELDIPESALAETLSPEDVHIFELSPRDWGRLVRLAGWRIVDQSIYWQYPQRAPARVTAPMWRALDFEGFLGVIMTRDLKVADRYTGW